MQFAAVCAVCIISNIIQKTAGFPTEGNDEWRSTWSISHPTFTPLKITASEPTYLLEKLHYTIFARQVIKHIDSEEEFLQLENIKHCGQNTKCFVKKHVDLFHTEPNWESESLAYVILEDQHYESSDQSLQNFYGSHGRTADVSCGVTCENCWHKNMVHLWESAYSLFFDGAIDRGVNIISIGANFEDFVDPLLANDIPINHMIAETKFVFDEDNKYVVFEKFGSRDLDILHVDTSCGLLFDILDLPWERKPKLVSLLPNRQIPPPFAFSGAENFMCSLSYLVSKLAARNYVLFKHTDRVTLFRQFSDTAIITKGEELIDEFMCFASYPLLEPNNWIKEKVIPIRYTQEWMDLGPREGIIDRIKSNLTWAVGHENWMLYNVKQDVPEIHLLEDDWFAEQDRLRTEF